MIGLAKSVLHWYEKTACDYVGGTPPNQNDPITLDRLWEVCKTYARGANPTFFSEEKSHYRDPSYDNRFSFHFFFNIFPNFNSISRSKSNSNSGDNSLITGFFIALAAICLAVFISVWVISGIAFQHVIRNSVTSAMSLAENTFSVLIGILGAAAGIVIGAVKGIFSSREEPYFEFIKSGANVGYKQGSTVGVWFSWFAGIAIIPAAVVLSLPLGIALGLPIGALTLVVAPLQFIKTTSNYIDSKFEEELDNNNNHSPNSPNSPQHQHHNEPKQSTFTPLINANKSKPVGNQDGETTTCKKHPYF